MFLFNLVVVKSLAALLPHPPCIYHLPQQYGRSVLAISRLLMQDLHYRQARINTNKISELQRAHGHVGTILHDIINVLLRPYTRF